MQIEESFAHLKEQVGQAERIVVAAARQKQAEVEAKVDVARKSSEERVAELGDEGEGRTEQAAHLLQQIHRDWQRHIERMRKQVDNRKAVSNLAAAEREAHEAESSAIGAIDLAAAVIQEAEYAVLGALLARKNAELLRTSA